jgi:hypothetical protein
MNTNTVKLPAAEGKKAAWMLRQNDTGWGRVLCQAWIPYYALYYAFTRRTITPWLWALVITMPAIFAVGIANYNKSDGELEGLGYLTSFVVSPFGYKLGTNKARDYAKRKLEEE